MDTALKMILIDIEAELSKIEKDQEPLDEVNFNERADTLDFIDFHILDRIDGLLSTDLPNEELNLLQQRAEAFKQKLEKVDTILYRRLRGDIRNGVYRKLSFADVVNKYIGINEIELKGEAGYDNLDIFINGSLADRELPEPTIASESEMVFYQQTPARIIFELATKLRADDVFFDLGSGLGQVAILVDLITGVTAKGIEYEPAYCDYANASAIRLNLNGVEFINMDARDADYSQGTVFFMYTPFSGKILADVLALLKNESQKRPIRIFTYGPCSAEVARQEWLMCLNGDGQDIYKLYEFGL